MVIACKRCSRLIKIFPIDKQEPACQWGGGEFEFVFYNNVYAFIYYFLYLLDRGQAGALHWNASVGQFRSLYLIF